MTNGISVAIKWTAEHEPAPGYIDVFPLSLFRETGERRGITHSVVGPRGKRYELKCDVRVRKQGADIDYQRYAKWNDKHDFLSGVLRLRFTSPERDRIDFGEWRGVRESEFAKGLCVAVAAPTLPAPRKKDISLAGSLDTERRTLARREQHFIRGALLLGRTQGECAICGEHLPDFLLVAAHLKPRADCTQAEKRDYRNNVLLMCKLGCDALFESGRITVAARGTIVSKAREEDTEAVRRYLKTLKGKRCAGWAEERAAYFRWHREHAVAQR